MEVAFFTTPLLASYLRLLVLFIFLAQPLLELTVFAQLACFALRKGRLRVGLALRVDLVAFVEWVYL